MKTHWLHGKVELKVEVEKETNCQQCLHLVVCTTSVRDRCANFKFGCTGEVGCASCTHHYTRFAQRDPIPCFKCLEFKQIDAQEYLRRQKLRRGK